MFAVLSQKYVSNTPANRTAIAFRSLCHHFPLSPQPPQVAGLRFPHTPNNLHLRIAIPLSLAQGSDTPQIAHDILGLAKVDLLQQVAHLELHVLHQAANVGNVALVVLDGQVLLDLARHVTREIDLAERVALGGQREDDGRGEAVVGGAAALRGFEDVDGVPDAGGGGVGWGGCSTVGVSMTSK